MSQEVILAIIAMVSGGGLTAVIKVVIENSKSKREERLREVDDRIATWQKVCEKYEVRLTMLEQKVEIYERDFRSIERYILALEHVIVHANPPLHMPERPVLERDTKLAQLSAVD
jgi:predicted RNase H-like nuclease (RuvC/YqgF family)